MEKIVSIGYDNKGKLWHEFTNGQGFRFAQFYGFTTKEKEPIWIAERYDPPVGYREILPLISCLT